MNQNAQIVYNEEMQIKIALRYSICLLECLKFNTLITTNVKKYVDPERIVQPLKKTIIFFQQTENIFTIKSSNFASWHSVNAVQTVAI